MDESFERLDAVKEYFVCWLAPERDSLHQAVGSSSTRTQALFNLTFVGLLFRLAAEPGESYVGASRKRFY